MRLPGGADIAEFAADCAASDTAQTAIRMIGEHRLSRIVNLTLLVAKKSPGVKSPPVACVTHQKGKHLHRFEPGVVIGPDVDKDTIHHKELARFHRVFDNVQCLITERVQALAVQLEQLREEIAGARRVRFPARPARHAELARDRGDLDRAAALAAGTPRGAFAPARLACILFWPIPLRFKCFGHFWPDRMFANQFYCVLDLIAPHDAGIQPYYLARFDELKLFPIASPDDALFIFWFNLFSGLQLLWLEYRFVFMAVTRHNRGHIKNLRGVLV
jgi:hypothetical protein